MSLPPDARSTYVSFDPPENEPRARKHRLVREVKRVIEVVAHLDANRADPDVVAEATDAARALAELLDGQPSLLATGGLGAQAGPQGSLLERSGISGRSNPLAPPVQWTVGDDGTHGSAVYSRAYEGPIGHVHGGFVAAAFDDLMGFAQSASGTASSTRGRCARPAATRPSGSSAAVGARSTPSRSSARWACGPSATSCPTSWR